MKDVNGREITAGDVVVTAQRRGSSSWLNTYNVLRIDEEKGLVLRKPIGSKYDRPFYYKAGKEAIAVIGESVAASLTALDTFMAANEQVLNAAMETDTFGGEA